MLPFSESSLKYDEKAIWGSAWFRMESKVLALKARVDEDVRRCEARGEEPRDMSKRTKIIAPIAKFSREGELVWNDELVNKIKDKFKKEKQKAGTSAGDRRPNR